MYQGREDDSPEVCSVINAKIFQRFQANILPQEWKLKSLDLISKQLLDKQFYRSHKYIGRLHQHKALLYVLANFYPEFLTNNGLFGLTFHGQKYLKFWNQEGVKRNVQKDEVVLIKRFIRKIKLNLETTNSNLLIHKEFFVRCLEIIKMPEVNYTRDTQNRSIMSR